jgi:hypothetical protein
LIVGAFFLLVVASLAEVVSRLGLALIGNETSDFAGLGRRKEAVATGQIDDTPGGANAARLLTVGTSLHPFLGYVQTPRPVDRAWLDHHHLPINEQGFIDDKPSVQRRAAGRRIVGITGGSVAFFLGSEGVERLRERLAALPAFAGREIVFVRLALGGFKEPQQLATLAYLLSLGGEFDLLINLDGFNEVALYPAEGAPIGANPAYPRAWPRLIDASASPERLRALGAEGFWSHRRRRWATLFSGPALDRSAFATVLWGAGDRWLFRRVERAQEAFRTLAGHLSYSATGPRIELTSSKEMFAALAAIWEHSSLQLANLCRANGIAYFHFLQPNQYLEGSKPMGSVERQLAIDPNSPHAASIAAGYPLLSAAGARLAAAGVEFTDLTQLFSSVEAPLYKDSYCHFNLEGNRRLADAIADRIAATPAPAGTARGASALHSP